MADDDDEPIPDGDEAELGDGAASAPKRGWRSMLEGRTGWVVVFVIALLQGVFAFVMIMLKGSGKQADDEAKSQMQALAVEMLGREVALKQINQLVGGTGGRRMTIGLDLVLVLGQLPEERIAGAPRPTNEEFEAFMAAIRDMEPRIRSRMNILLQKIPYDEYGSPEAADRIKSDMLQYVNDELDGLAFSTVRPVIGKRRVTDVLMPLFIRQPM